MKLDYLVMCSKCEVRMHPDDYKKHKKHCNTDVTTTTADISIIGVSDGSTTFGNAYSAGTTLTDALSS